MLPHAVLVELHSWGSGDSKDLTKIEPGFALTIAVWVSFQFECMDVRSCWVCVVTALLDVGVGVVADPAPAKSLFLSPAGAGSSARSLLSVRRDGAGGRMCLCGRRSESHHAKHRRLNPSAQ